MLAGLMINSVIKCSKGGQWAGSQFAQMHFEVHRCRFTHVNPIVLSHALKVSLYLFVASRMHFYNFETYDGFRAVHLANRFCLNRRITCAPSNYLYELYVHILKLI